MTIAITGALGHIGSRLIRELPVGSRIILIDNLATQRYCSLFNLPGDRNYAFHEADILMADLQTMFKSASVVIHLAALTDAAKSVGSEEEVERINHQGTHRVADACAATGAALIYISTTSVYSPKGKQIAENCLPEEISPQTPYASAKLAGEKLLAEFPTLRYVICRFGTIFGTSPGMRFHTAVNRFCWQAVFGQPLSVWRTAFDQRRPYLDLGDAVAALNFIIEHQLFTREVYNIVTLNAAVSDIVNAIRTQIPDLNVKLTDSAIMNQLSYDVSAEKFRERGFTFRGDLAAGVEQTIRLLRPSNAG